MDKLIMLGTGHAMTTECFNTCFVYENEHGKMLVDTGGGQQLLGRFRTAEINADEIDCVFLTHRHTDHLLGLPWFVRMRRRNLAQNPIRILAHEELCGETEALLRIIFPDLAEEIGRSLILIPLQDGEVRTECGRQIMFYDIQSERDQQFGFVMTLENGGKFVYNGDMPFHESNRERMQNADYLMHEAYALTEDMHQSRGGHSSVAQTAKYADSLGAKTLIIVHGGDRNLSQRREKYTFEASEHFKGNILVPYDLETINL